MHAFESERLIGDLCICINDMHGRTLQLVGPVRPPGGSREEPRQNARRALNAASSSIGHAAPPATLAKKRNCTLPARTQLTWNRPKDRDDILGVMLANQAVLDQTYLLKWGQELEVESLFQELCLECKEIADE